MHVWFTSFADERMVRLICSPTVTDVKGRPIALSFHLVDGISSMIVTFDLIQHVHTGDI